MGRKPPTFTDACKLADAIMTCGYEFNSGKIVYNRFKSVVSYNTQDLPLYSLAAVSVSIVIANQQIRNLVFSKWAPENTLVDCILQWLHTDGIATAV